MGVVILLCRRLLCNVRHCRASVGVGTSAAGLSDLYSSLSTRELQCHQVTGRCLARRNALLPPRKLLVVWRDGHCPTSLYTAVSRRCPGVARRFLSLRPSLNPMNGCSMQPGCWAVQMSCYCGADETRVRVRGRVQQGWVGSMSFVMFFKCP